jgi:hypothetical protein
LVPAVERRGLSAQSANTSKRSYRLDPHLLGLLAGVVKETVIEDALVLSLDADLTDVPGRTEALGGDQVVVEIAGGAQDGCFEQAPSPTVHRRCALAPIGAGSRQPHAQSELAKRD